MSFSYKQVEKAKRAVCQVMCVNREFNWTQPYLECEETQCSGTAFFIDAVKEFAWGSKLPTDHKDTRYLLTNFHVVEAVVNGQCLLRYPDRGHSTMTATVKFICPALDVAILAVDPHGTHPMWFDSGDIRDFIEQIPNLPLETKKPIKGNSQPVMAIGFPNASQDYQLCKGYVSSFCELLQ